jgi:azurin
VELSGRDSRAVIAATQRWLGRFDPKKREHARAFLEALWLHQQHHAENPALLAQVLASPEPHARVAAATVRHFLNPPPPPAPALASAHAGHGATPAAATPAPAQKSGVVRETADLVEIRLGTVVEAMRYDVTKLTVPAGKRVRLTFFNPDAMPHNWLLVRPGKADAVGEAAVALGARGFELNWVPPGGDVLAATKLVDHNREEVLEFTAPATPGDYPYVCSFPGHHLLMRGVLTVR